MGKNTKAAGNARELQVRRILEQDGWTVKKAYASFGAADLVATKLIVAEGINSPVDDEVTMLKWLIQVKANKGNAYKNFGPKDREELKLEAKLAGARATLVHWPPRCDRPGGYWIDAQDWPK